MVLNPVGIPPLAARSAGGVSQADGTGRTDRRLRGEISEPNRPDRDAYVPQEPPLSAGVYRPERDAEGNPRIRFDRPDAAPVPPEGNPARAAERAVYDTDRVDREIRALKEKIEQLQKRLDRERDPERADALGRRLAQLEAELRQKDTDAYRRQHADRS